MDIIDETAIASEMMVYEAISAFIREHGQPITFTQIFKRTESAMPTVDQLTKHQLLYKILKNLIRLELISNVPAGRGEYFEILSISTKH